MGGTAPTTTTLLAIPAAPRARAYSLPSDHPKAPHSDFAVAYSAQNQQDYEAFLAAIDSGRLPVSDVF